VFAIMSTFGANGVKNLADTARLVGESMEGWLRGFDGYAGLLILTNEDERRARVVTFWETLEALKASAAGRETVRNSLAERLGVTVEAVEWYEVSRRADLALG
jgi:heme-degrading monooxygenase HmoA